MPWTVACQAPLSMGFSRQPYWSGLPFPSPGILPNPRIEPRSPALKADSLPPKLQGKPKFLYTPLWKNKWKQSFLPYCLPLFIPTPLPFFLPFFFLNSVQKPWNGAKWGRGVKWWREEWCHSMGYWSPSEVRTAGFTGDSWNSSWAISNPKRRCC